MSHLPGTMGRWHQGTWSGVFKSPPTPRKPLFGRGIGASGAMPGRFLLATSRMVRQTSPNSDQGDREA